MTQVNLALPGRRGAVHGVLDRLRGNLTLIVLIALLIVLILLPIGRLLMSSFQLGHPAMPEGWTIENYQTAFTNPTFYSALGTTIWIAGVGTLITVTIAIVFAWLVERTDMPFRNLAWALILIPMALPGVLFALGWTLLLSPRAGALNVVLREMLSWFGIVLTTGPFDIYNVAGLIFLDGLRGVTTVFLMVVGAFRLMDPSLEEAARVSRAGALGTLFKVTLPAMLPAILAAAMYSFISSMESFEAALAVGMPGGVFVLSTLIYFMTRIQAPINYGLASVFGVAFMLIMMLLLVFYRRAMRYAERFATVSGKGFRPRVISLGRWRYPALSLFAVYFLLSVVAPFALLFWLSLLPIYRVPSLAALDLVSLQSYVTVFDTPRVGRVVLNTVTMVLAAATVTMLAAFLVSWVIMRSHVRGRGLLDGLAFIPHAIPGVIIALALVMAFLTPPLSYTGLYGSVWMLVIALTVSYIAFGTRLMNGSIVQIHHELEQASYVSGAGTLKTLFKITLPLLFPAFAAGWIWVAVHSLRSFSIPLMMSSRSNEVLAVLLWEYWEDGNATLSAALGVLLIVFLIPVTLLMRRFIVRASGQQS